MIFVYDWLKEYVPELPQAKDLADLLTMAGIEVEAITRTIPEIIGVISAEVLTVDKHPNADRLRLCSVSTGKETKSIVCGASNMKPGDKVALALPGALLPNGVKIGKSKIRGIESGGMMCSTTELGINATSDGILILDQSTRLGLDINEVLGSDTLLHVSITPNRADILSIRGLAREICALSGSAFVDKAITVEEGEGSVEGSVKVSIEEGAPCRRYMARVARGVNIGPSPEFMRRRLEASGIRPINNVVDITNYVLLETGQPLHAFDLKTVAGGAINVIKAPSGLKIETLDAKTRDIEPGSPVICDASGPVALAGVMGGKGTEVTDATKDVLIEGAWFVPTAVRISSRRSGVSTDSSYRFERGVDMGSVGRAVDMAAELMRRHAGATIEKGAIDARQGEVKTSTKVSLSIERAKKILGMEIGASEAASIFKRLGFGVAVSSSTVEVDVPGYRFDINIEADLVEEIARVVGYSRVPTAMPRVALGAPSRTGLFDMRSRVKEIMVGAGFYEAVNYSFVSPLLFGLTGPIDRPCIRLQNPLSEDLSIMRDSLVPSLVDVAVKNVSRKNDDVFVFEFAPVYRPSGSSADEQWRISALMHDAGLKNGWNGVAKTLDYYDAKGIVERLIKGLRIDSSIEYERPAGELAMLFHPGRSSVVNIGNRRAGILGELHPELTERFGLNASAQAFELDVDSLMNAIGPERRYAQLPRFPESTRDIAFVADEAIGYKDFLDAIKGLKLKIIENVEVFDVYYGGNIPKAKRSVALRVVFRSPERTLTQAEVDEAFALVRGALEKGFNVEVRGV